MVKACLVGATHALPRQQYNIVYPIGLTSLHDDPDEDKQGKDADWYGDNDTQKTECAGPERR